MNDTKKKIRNPFAEHGKTLAASNPGFANFYALALAAADEEDLAHMAPERFESLLRHSHERLGKRGDKPHLIHIWSPDTDIPTDVQIIDVFAPNMPFLVDSVLAAIRAMGGTIQLFSHPILPVDPSTQPWTVLQTAEKNTQRESFLQVHIDPITDEKLLAELHAELDAVLTEVAATVRGWRPMLERLRKLVQDYRTNAAIVPAPDLAEALHFLAWLAEHNFTFLGMREYELIDGPDGSILQPIPESGVGILENPDLKFLRHGTDYVEMTEQHVAFLRRSEPLMVTKANIQARVHRRAHMDYVGVKLYGDDGNLTGELRIVGLFTSMSLATPHTEVPLLRRKISDVMRRSGFDLKSHAGKGLMAALDNYPRDEMFQISESQLFEFGNIIAALADRPRVRILPRVDRFDNFVSVLTYLPRERYTSDVREHIGNHLAKAYDGRVSAYYPSFPEGELVRVHFIIGRNGGVTPRPDRQKLETEITDLTRDFGDRLTEAAEDPGAIAGYLHAFSGAYESAYGHDQALVDIAMFKTLGDESDLAVKLDASTSREGAYSLRLYHKGTPIPLSDRVPMLEHFGFRVIDEQSHAIQPLDGQDRYLHDMIIRRDAEILDIEKDAARIERALLAVWHGDAESDDYNKLCVSAELEWDQTSILRALGHYLRQVGVSYSQRYLAATLNTYPALSRIILNVFTARLSPKFEGDREEATNKHIAEIEAALAEVSSLDEDRIIRHFLNLTLVSLRTNFWQKGEDKPHRPALAIKYDSDRVDGLPDPKPYREIFVYSPRVEGIHLRGGEIARGGLRWSDRPEDFRTEVLGLAKAQMVKNAVIVPVGAKGGFVPRQMPANPDRETFITEGTECYKIFIGALLDITDNLDGDTILPPSDVVRTDGDDPYLVVAADKGTATFSDTANAISQSRDFWLDDAFASGGSVGYDHKKMGITARGGWEAVKRHFREINHDTQAKPFTVVGVGDMSGDVFGNGMLLSRHIRLVAAFDHRDIFIDPDPDPETSVIERERLFNKGRSSWQDYDKSLLSKGGDIFPRSSKSITLTDEIRAALDITSNEVTPNQLIGAILRANADLMWFGGIGTYIRANNETNLDVGDRANDAIRITPNELRVKAIGEGANLGITQLARIEFAALGGRINTDAIDNSAGVNSSDLEVNIKIALGTLVRDDSLKIEDRNSFLVTMTDEVAGLCLRNNYLQTLALSLAQRKAQEDFPDHIALMQSLEQAGDLNRAVEYLPDDLVAAQRLEEGKPLTRPELAVLLAYAKNTLYTELLTSNVPDDPYLATELYRYFPAKLKAQYPVTIDTHRLRREVIATVLANAMINRGGVTFIHKAAAATSASGAEIAFAYAAARDTFDLPALNLMIDGLDGALDGNVQLELYAEVQTLMVNQTLWFLRNVSFAQGLSGIVEQYRAGIATIRANLGTVLPRTLTEAIADQAVGFVNGGTPRDVARRIAELSVLTLGTEIVLVAEKSGADITEATQAYFAVMSKFSLGRITEEGGYIALIDRYDRMALDRALTNILKAQRNLTANVLTTEGGTIPERFTTWHGQRSTEIDRIATMVTDITEGELTLSRLAVAAGLLSDLERK